MRSPSRLPGSDEPGPNAAGVKSASPYRIAGPAIISFSGGRTSGFMLRQIIDAWGGALPDDVRVAFSNTGKEREETLVFIHECETRWRIRVHWLERVDGPGRFREADFSNASRHGEPFAAVIRRKAFTPNPVTRFWTNELKVRTMRDFARSLGWTHWTNIIGLRHDEGHRCLKAYDRNASGNDPWTVACPMDKARVTRRDVLAFWETQPFDLALRSYEGNCDLCFLKSRGKLLTIIREHPEAAQWWIDQEAAVGGRFRDRHSYASLAEAARRQLVFPFMDDDGQDEHDAECGLICEPD
jgi:3'-phosphoadenosine 5'-phosphosulfate sulfotransferase (PAPS reductase)/FAD synthetase